jgi:hypothetical protein
VHASDTAAVSLPLAQVFQILAVQKRIALQRILLVFGIVTDVETF